jgi:ABC-2 type transport system permease protein
MVYSAWAFPILVFPFHLALHRTLHANAAYAASFPLFLVPFTVLVGSAGAILACALATFGITWQLIRRLLIACAAGFLVYYLLTGATSALPQLDDDPVRFLQATLAKFSLGFSPYSPAGWWFRGAEAMRAGDLATALGYWCVMMSTGLALLWITLAFAPGPLFRLWAGWSGSRTKRSTTNTGFFSLDRLLGFLSPQTRAMVVKDARLLARDPGQWAQSVLLFGLMATYVAGLRGMAYQSLPLQWRLLVTTANFGAIAGILASLGTRFFFPLPSLEGKMAWLIRLAPVDPQQALRLKLVLGLAWTYPPTLALAAGTIIMLDLPRTLLFIAVLDTLLLDIALMSLSVGLGAILPEMGQEETSKIVSGLGGTVALLLGLTYVLVSAGLVALQLGLIPVLRFSTAHLTGTAALTILSLGISYTVMKSAAHRVRSLEVAA